MNGATTCGFRPRFAHDRFKVLEMDARDWPICMTSHELRQRSQQKVVRLWPREGRRDFSLRRCWYLRGFTLYLHPVLYNLSAFLAILSSSLSTYDLHTYEKIFSFQIAIEQTLYPGENLFSTKNSFF